MLKADTTLLSFTSKELEELSLKVKRHSGIYYPKERLNELKKNASNFLKSGKYSGIENILESLEALDEFCIHLTVGETYFFRHKVHFDHLASYVKQKISDLSKPQKEIRIWSAACSSGEEPYSMAMKLNEEELFHQGTKISIYASDLDHIAIQKARKGVYTDWSFREINDELVKKYFATAPKGPIKNLMQISPQIKSKVEFFINNLTTTFISYKEVFSSPFDVIFCRNVLIYFAMDTIEDLGKLFHKLLNDGGLLFVSPAESSLISSLKLFKCVDIGSSFVFEKSPLEETNQVKTKSQYQKVITPPSPKTKVVISTPNILHKKALPDKPKPDPLELLEKNLFKELISTYSDDIFGFLLKPFLSDKEEALIKLYVKSLIKESSFDTAHEICSKAINKMKLDTELRFLHAKILIEIAKEEEAVEQLKKVLYLDSKNLIAHFLIGNLMLSKNRKAQAKKHFMAVAAILSSMSPDKILNEADGSSVQELKLVTDTILTNLNSEDSDE